MPYQGEDNTLGDDLREYHLRRGADGWRMPISVVRSFTVTIMMLETPMAPARRVPMPTSQMRKLTPLNRLSSIWKSTSVLNTMIPFFVRRVDVVGSGYGFTHPLGDAAHHYARFTGGGDDVDGGSPVVGGAEHRLRNGDGFVGSTAEVHAISRAVIYTYHRVIGGIHSHALAARVTAAREEGLVNLFADDANLALAAHIHLVDVSAVKHFRRGNLGVVGIYALGAAAEFLVAKHHRLVASEEQRGDDIEFGHPGGAVCSRSFSSICQERPLLNPL